MPIRGEWKFVQPQVGGVNKYQFNGIELNDDFGLNWNMARFRSYDPSIGKWNGVDPEAEMYYSWNSYNMALGNPIINSDPSGATVVDPNGKPVGISINTETNQLSYAFSDKYSGKKLDKIRTQFMEETAPVLESMAKTSKGREDIETLNSIPTKVTIIKDDGTNDLVNSYVYPGRLDKKTGYRYDVMIKPFFGNHKKNNVEADFDEWLGASMTVEVGHLEKDQIKLDDEAYMSNPDYLEQPESEEFKTSYYPLLNRAASYRIKYRQEHKQPITKDVFSPLDHYNIKYNEFNKTVRRKIDN